NVAYPQWALAYAQGYNDYIHARYLKRSPRFQAVALIPMQSGPDAVAELRRAVKELGFLGAMIPSNGLTRHVSHAEHWPIYEEAEKLNCIMAVHGGSYINLGFNTYPVHVCVRFSARDLDKQLYGGDRRNPGAGGSQEGAQGRDSRRERTAVLRALR